MKKKTMLMVAAVAMLFASCGKSGGGLPMGDNEFPVITLGASDASLEKSYPATIKGIQDIEVRPKISGFITKIYVHEGEVVKPGQPLFAIDSETYQAGVRQAKAAVKTAEAQLSTVTLSYENSKTLYEKGIIGQYEMSAAENSYATAQAGLAQTKAALTSATEQLQWCNITATVAGVVGDIPFKVGNLVSASNVLTTVSKNSTMEVYFSMSESEMLKLVENAGDAKSAIEKMPAVRLKLINGDLYEHEGKVTKMSGVINTTTGSVQLIAQFENPANLLKSGGAGQVIIPEHNDAAIVVPQEACSQIQDKFFVYAVTKENTVKHSEITVNPQNDGHTYIVTGGLNTGDRIVVKGITKLKDGQQIAPITMEQYNKKIDDAAALAKSQGRAGDFVDAMSGK